MSLDFCLDASFDWDVFKGTVAFVCATERKILCQTNKSCVSLCCHNNHYFDWEIGSCQRGPNNISFPSVEFVNPDTGTEIGAFLSNNLKVLISVYL